MTILEVVAILVGAVLGWASGALKTQLHSMRRPRSSLGSGGECHRDLGAGDAPQRPRGAPGHLHQPHAARQALFAHALDA